MSTITRTLGYLRRIGLKACSHPCTLALFCPTTGLGQPANPRSFLGILAPTQRDTKAGTLIGVDKFGNKFYENMEEELPLRTRWVDYKKHDYDAAQIEPLWHLWISYGIDTPPNQDPIAQTNRTWASSKHIPNYTATRGAYKPYNTTKPKISAWIPEVAPRQ
ncbi:uncharacterized protein E0L32_009288 [Thyridium curvatum]|uniref:NADH dehydrogenase [ubiquinone] 1 alpha subcomplex subunit n=1 Tax=Thyridium curvatum TaxID=1093900 RepID=A0A507AHR0_9PEZI|nr:uncharacterized protein E0L32_009288 [Thyridium curvatum]TPX09545.1 hypothetical protein E0L32_009288 [Thyridium curvatum]